MKRVWSGLIVSLALVGLAWGYPGQRGPGVVGAGTQARSEFIILGTASGPNSEANRAQPANALLVGGQPYLIDAGDDAVAQLAKANLRFDLADRSIVYTGDTGPSKAFVSLARGADLLVSEMIDVDAVLAGMRPAGARATAPNATPTRFEWHMHAHHITPTQVGELAKAAEVKRVVITHFAPNPTGPEQARGYLNAIHAQFPGDVQLGADLGRY